MVKNLKKGGLYHWRNPEQKYHHEWTINTAGDVSSSLQPETGYKIKILYGGYLLDASADAANRYLQINHTDDKDVKYYYWATAAVTANQDGSMVITTCKENANINPHYTASEDLEASLELPIGLIIYELDKLTIAVTNGHANDTISGKFKYLKVPVNQPFPQGE